MEEDNVQVTPCFTSEGINFMHIRISNLYSQSTVRACARVCREGGRRAGRELVDNGRPSSRPNPLSDMGLSSTSTCTEAVHSLAGAATVVRRGLAGWSRRSDGAACELVRHPRRRRELADVHRSWRASLAEMSTAELAYSSASLVLTSVCSCSCVCSPRPVEAQLERGRDHHLPPPAGVGADRVLQGARGGVDPRQLCHRLRAARRDDGLWVPPDDRVKDPPGVSPPSHAHTSLQPGPNRRR